MENKNNKSPDNNVPDNVNDHKEIAENNVPQDINVTEDMNDLFDVSFLFLLFLLQISFRSGMF